MLEWYEYFPISYTTVSMADVRQSLPQAIQQELIHHPETFQGSVAVEAEKGAVIAELDKLLRTESATEFQKERFVEIRRNEIQEFSYYHIVPMRIDPQHIHYELDTPQCDKCLWGLHLHPPIKLGQKVRAKCDLGQVTLVRSMDIELIISERMKVLFDSEGISGLKYESIDNSSFYHATITSSAWQHGDSIVLSGNYCEKHLVVSTPAVINRTTPVDNIEGDFVTIRGVDVDGKKYTYIPPWWVVSQKVLKILLGEVKGLQRVTIRLNEKFRPCLGGRKRDRSDRMRGTKRGARKGDKPN